MRRMAQIGWSRWKSRFSVYEKGFQIALKTLPAENTRFPNNYPQTQ